MAFLAPEPDAPPPSPSFVSRYLRELTGQGFSSVVTAALAPTDAQAFVSVGFEEQERLRLLSHDLRDLPRRAGPRPRRVRPQDWTAVLTVDSASFAPFWRLDHAGLHDAVAATPTARFRLLAAPTTGAGAATTAGYALTGRAGRQGFVQRLAVRPEHQGHGLGRILALDALHWLRRCRARRAVVNTQQGNEVALSFYRHLGFRAEPSDLIVLRRDLA